MDVMTVKDDSAIRIEFSFDGNVAIILDDRKAMLLKDFVYLCKSKINPKDLKHGLPFYWYSAKELGKKYRHLDTRSISRWLTQLCKDGWLYSIVCNEKSYDKTKSYFVNYIAYSDACNGKVDDKQRADWVETVKRIVATKPLKTLIGQNDQGSLKPLKTLIGQNDQSIGQNDQPIPTHTYSLKEKEKKEKKLNTLGGSPPNPLFSQEEELKKENLDIDLESSKCLKEVQEKENLLNLKNEPLNPPSSEAPPLVPKKKKSELTEGEKKKLVLKKRIGKNQFEFLMEILKEIKSEELSDWKKIHLVNYLEHRRLLKKPYKKISSLKSLIGKFQNHKKEEIKLVLDNSMGDGREWIGLFWKDVLEREKRKIERQNKFNSQYGNTGNGNEQPIRRRRSDRGGIQSPSEISKKILNETR